MGAGTYGFLGYRGKPYLPLYKYYSNYDYAEDAIVNQRLHLELPQDYNDLYDCYMRVTSEEYLKQLYNLRKYLREILKAKLDPKYHALLLEWSLIDPDNYGSVHSFLEYACSHDQSIDRQELTTQCINATSDDGLVRSTGIKVTCFSERKDSLLMWAYYANNYSGVCLEFDAKSDEILNKYCSKVQYSHTMYSNGNAPTDFNDNHFIKSYEWAHEQEWRLVAKTDEEYFPTKSLKSIILGRRIPEEQMERFISLGVKYNLGVQMMIPDSKDFKLNFIPIVNQ